VPAVVQKSLLQLFGIAHQGDRIGETQIIIGIIGPSFRVFSKFAANPLVIKTVRNYPHQPKRHNRWIKKRNIR
jgi:hypothetical protein